MLKLILSCVLVVATFPVVADGEEAQGTSSSQDEIQNLITELGLREAATASRDLPGWSPAKKIVVRQGRPGALEEYQALAPDVEFVMVESLEQARKQAVDAQAVLGYCDEEMLSNSPRLFWIQVYASGVERCVSNPSMHTGNRLLTNGQRIGSPALAEHAIAMMMMLARGMDVYLANQLKGVDTTDTTGARGSYRTGR